MKEGYFCRGKAKQRKGKKGTILSPVFADLWRLPAGPQLWQTLQTGAQIQLQLPPGSLCRADDAGLLPVFQGFILDELVARGFCQIQVGALPCLRGLGGSSGSPRQRTSGLK